MKKTIQCGHNGLKTITVISAYNAIRKPECCVSSNLACSLTLINLNLPGSSRFTTRQLAEIRCVLSIGGTKRDASAERNDFLLWITQEPWQTNDCTEGKWILIMGGKRARLIWRIMPGGGRKYEIFKMSKIAFQWSWHSIAMKHNSSVFFGFTLNSQIVRKLKFGTKTLLRKPDRKYFSCTKCKKKKKKSVVAAGPTSR